MRQIGVRLLVGSGAIVALVLATSLASPVRAATAPAPFSSVPGAVTGTTPVDTLPQCAAGDHPTARLQPDLLNGPAGGTVDADRFVHSWSLDGGNLVVDPPAATDVPTVKSRQAACNLIAGFTPNNFPLADIVGQGSVLGLGRLTVSPKVHQGDLYEWNPPAGVPTYQDRLAWILAVQWGPPSSCPAMGTSPSATAASKPSPSADYEVFAVSARTGGAALTYVARSPFACGGPGTSAASVTRGFQQVSLPWHLRWMSNDRKTATVNVSYSTCPTEDADDPVNVDRGSTRVRVVAFRGYGPACGPARRHIITIWPATVTTTIPPVLTHAPVGPIDTVD